MAGPVLDPRVTRIYVAFSEDCARASARAIARLNRLPASVRRDLDPYALILRRDGAGPQRPD